MDVVFQELSADEIKALLDPFEDTETSQDAGCISKTSRDLQQVIVDDFISDQKKKNTESSTKRDVKNVQRWLYNNKKEPRSLENIPP